MLSAVVLIPARYQSTRFPGKPLASIAGRPMIQWVYEHCAASGLATYVVTDHDLIEETVLGFAGKCLRVNDDVPSGSERIALAYQRYLKKDNIQLVINVQGDEPLLPGSEILELAKFHLAGNWDITTLVRPRISDEADFQNPNVVKAIVTDKGQCLYFSRAGVPFPRDGKKMTWWQHIGVYGYRAQALEKFVTWPESPLENTEKLEQLRALENGLTIGALKTNVRLVGVDTPEDVARVEGVLRE